MEMNVDMLLWLWIIIAPAIAFIALSSFGGSPRPVELTSRDAPSLELEPFRPALRLCWQRYRRDPRDPPLPALMSLEIEYRA